MKRHPVEEFLRNQTSLLMQKHLLITKNDPAKILENLSRRQMKIFADNIPNLQKYIDYIATGDINIDTA
jgi:hypothetical protein